MKTVDQSIGECEFLTSNAFDQKSTFDIRIDRLRVLAVDCQPYFIQFKTLESGFQRVTDAM